MLNYLFKYTDILCCFLNIVIIQERDILRIDTLSANESKKAKIVSRIEHLRKHVEEVQNQKESLNERLCANNESIGRVQGEINTICSDSSKPGEFTCRGSITLNLFANYVTCIHVSC